MNTSNSFAPTFIVGVPRSGTTLLVNLLGMHPLLSPIYETRFLRNLLLHCEKARWFWGDSGSRKILSFLGESWEFRRFEVECKTFREKTISFDDSRVEANWGKQPHESFPFGSRCIYYRREELERETDRWLKRLQGGPLPEEEIYGLAREYVCRLFSFHSARMEKPYWINKTPGLLRHLYRIPKLFPSCRVINIVRDGRDIAVSNLGLRWGPNTVAEAAVRWRNLLLQGRKRIDLSTLQYLELRYEDLIQEPAGTLAKVLSFLGLDGDPDRLLSQISVYESRIGVWRSRFSAKERKIFARKAGDMLITLGYEKDRSWAHTIQSCQ